MKQLEFYVSSGEVALLTSSLKAAMVLDNWTQVEEAEAGGKCRWDVTTVEGGKKGSVVDLVCSPPFPLCSPSYFIF